MVEDETCGGGSEWDFTLISTAIVLLLFYSAIQGISEGGWMRKYLNVPKSHDEENDAGSYTHPPTHTHKYTHTHTYLHTYIHIYIFIYTDKGGDLTAGASAEAQAQAQAGDQGLSSSEYFCKRE
jgi:hypothetical protein